MSKTKYSQPKSQPESLSEFWEIISGYQRSRVLFTFVELGVSEMLREKPQTANEIAETLNIHPLAMERFLNSCVITGILKRENDLFSNTALAETFLTVKADFYLGGITRRHAKSGYAAWGDLTEKLKNWEYGKTVQDDPGDEDQGAEAMAEQHKLALLNGFALAESFDFSRHKKVLDLGGGTGAASIALCKTYTHLEAVVFDLPENAKIAQDFINKENLQNRIKSIGGDLKKDMLPENFDVALLANFMSVADDESNKKLLHEIYEKLPAGGAGILSGWIIDDSHLSPSVSVLFCLEDICREAPDVERSEKVYSGWLSDAGFTDIRCETFLYPTKMLYGFKN